jgi:hypothetical protein
MRSFWIERTSIIHPMKDLITRAISIRQPYIELILQGKKVKEFRSRKTNIRERVYLYAALRPSDDRASWTRSGNAIGSLPTGVIVGSIEIVDCKETVDGGFAYILKNPQRLRRYLIVSNQPQPGFWIPQF